MAANALVVGGVLLALCPRFTLDHDGSVQLTEPEKRLVCGDPSNEAWSHIPDNQAIYNLKSFLAARGYYDTTVERKDGRIIVHTGKLSRATAFRAEGAPEKLAVEDLRDIVGQRLTTALLDDVKRRLQQRLGARGYPCGTVHMRADPVTGVLTAKVDPGPAPALVEVVEDPIEGLDSRIMRRYHAFVLGEPYDEKLLAVTTQRILDQQIVQSTHFSTTCQGDGAHARQTFVVGPPRQITVGVGVDSERLGILRVAWRNNRLGRYGSQLVIQASASFLDQELSTSGQWYFLGYPSRFHLRPTFSVKHANEKYYENFTGKLQLTPATTWDGQSVGLIVSLGPVLNYIHTFRGVGPIDSTFFSLGLDARLRDHDLEYYRLSPRTGFEVRLEANVAQTDVLSPVTARFVRASFQKLWNVGSFDPPAIVVGARGSAGTTFTPGTVATLGALPTIFRHFLGGSTDLRGFSRQELPGPDGALTAVQAGLEVRFAAVLPWGLQPFVFGDVGALGASTASLDSPAFLSPGIGMRWQSPVGAVRGTLARGFLAGDRGAYAPTVEHFQAYFSFGEEF